MTCATSPTTRRRRDELHRPPYHRAADHAPTPTTGGHMLTLTTAGAHAMPRGPVRSVRAPRHARRARSARSPRRSSRRRPVRAGAAAWGRLGRRRAGRVRWGSWNRFGRGGAASTPSEGADYCGEAQACPRQRATRNPAPSRLLRRLAEPVDELVGVAAYRLV